jgi:uracil-DNA glycosylase
MLEKPAGCLGCPLYGDGRGFVPDELVPGAAVLILAQNPGGDEERGERVVGYSGGRPVYETDRPRPLIGKTGYELTTTYLPIAGLTRGKDVSLANVLKCRAVKNGRRGNDLPTGHTLEAAVLQCTSAHLRIPVGTRLVVAMGALAWKALGGVGSISDWRGFLK